MAKIYVIYHSMYGHTQKVAQSVLEGVKSVTGTEAFLLSAEEAAAKIDQLDDADGFIFGSPTYMGSVSAGLKAFFEASAKVWMRQGWKNKIAGGFTNSGSQNGDKLNTLNSLAIFAMQHGMVWVGLDLLPGNNSSKGSVNDLNRLGSWLGLMTQSNGDEGADTTPIESDLKTAVYFGKRIAEATIRWKKGE